MKACKSTYDYEQLVANYIEYNLSKDTEYNNSNLLPDYYTSTAKDRLSFNGAYLISYATSVTKFIHAKHNIYLFIDNYKYSVTTSKQVNILISNTPTNVIKLHVNDIDNSFAELKDYYLDSIYSIYAHCRNARNGKRLQILINKYKVAIHSVLPELHHQTRKATLRILADFPDVPNKLNKFTRPGILSILKSKGIL